MAKAKRGPLSQKTKERLSETQKRRFIEQVKARDPSLEPTEKRCPACREMKRLPEFGTRKYKRASGLIAVTPNGLCKPCEAKRVAAWKQRKVDEGTWAEYVKNKKPKNTNKIRRYQREYKAAKRREQGVPARKSAKETRVVVPVEPISVLLHLLEESYTREEISIRSGVEERRLYDIANLAVPNTSIDNVDKLLMGFDRESDLNELYPLEEKEELVAGYYYLDPEGVLKTPEEQVE